MPNQRPLCRSEEGMALNVGGTCACSKSSGFLFDKKFANQGFANASDQLVSKDG